MPTDTRRSVAADLFTASRPLSWVNTAYPFAAAYLLTTREVDLALVVGTLFFLVPYNLAMYGINDVFDYASDAANPRKGGVEGALLVPSRHRLTIVAAIALCLPFVVVLVALGGPASWAVLAVSLFAVAAYSVPGLRFKEVPFLDSLTSSVHFVSPAVYGLVLAGAAFTPQLLALLARVPRVGRREPRVRRRAGRGARPRGRHRVDRDGARGALARCGSRSPCGSPPAC